MKKIIEILDRHLMISQSDIENISFLGGMTNKNYLVLTKKDGLVIRIPGAMTAELINRQFEGKNSLVMSQESFNVETYFFDAYTGIKITKYLSNSQTLNHDTIKNIDYLKVIAQRLHQLHSLDIQFSNRFNVFSEFEKYLSLLKDKSSLYSHCQQIDKVLNFFYQVKNYLESKNIKFTPCHNDLVPENILFHNGSMFFIDWEYSGMNDPAFDIAAFLLESNLNENEQHLFFHYYYTGSDLEEFKKRVYLYQFTQDVLWFIWTLVKEENKEFFDDYAQKRIARAIVFMQNFNKEI